MDVDVGMRRMERSGVGVKNFNDLVHARKRNFGSTAPSGGTSLYPLFFKNAFGAPVKVINGYKTTKEVLLAMARGELDGTCGITQATSAVDMQSGNLDVLIHIGMDRHIPIYGKAIAISDVAKSGELRKIAELVFNPGLMTRPLATPPGVPRRASRLCAKPSWRTCAIRRPQQWRSRRTWRSRRWTARRSSA